MDALEDYFTLFGLKASPVVDPTRVEQQYKILQKAVHPDQFSSESDQQKRLAVQYSAYINQAYEVLKSPVALCEYLLVLAGYPIEMERKTLIDEKFLLEQMLLREQVDELKTQNIKTSAELNILINQVKSEQLNYLETFKNAWEQRESMGELFLDTVLPILQKMQFLNKVLIELEGVVCV